MKLSVEFRQQKLEMSVQNPSIDVSTGTLIARDYVERDPYTGDYVITPTAETQVLETRNLRMTDNVTVNPIPSNYGLITWNGAVLTVS